MSDNSYQTTGGERPRLRCPGCAAMVELPAETCPKCATNLRTGYAPPPSGSGRGRLIFGGLILVLIIGAAVAVLFFNEDKPYKAPVAGPVHSDISDAVESVQSISEDDLKYSGNPAQAKPILDTTRAVADRVSDRQHMTDDARDGE